MIVERNSSEIRDLVRLLSSHWKTERCRWQDRYSRDENASTPDFTFRQVSRLEHFWNKNAGSVTRYHDFRRFYFEIARTLGILWMTVNASRTEALRKLALPGDLVVWTMLPSFLGARWWGQRTPRAHVEGIPEEWKGSTGKSVSSCSSRATGHAPRLPSSLCWGLGKLESKDDRHKRKALAGFIECRARHAHHAHACRTLAPRFLHFIDDWEQ